MLRAMTAEIISQFLAWTPLVAFTIVLLVAYFSLRERSAGSTVTAKTYACAQCGRRGKHEHMVPVTQEGAVVWYCGRCASH
jgi:predicted SprT family Zn-dependent metalloprotease